MATMLAGRLDLEHLDFGVSRIEIPEPGTGEVRIQVGAAGICLSDVHLIDGTLSKEGIAATGLFQPVVTLGHEVAGTVEKIGPGVPPSWLVGARVLLSAGKRCGTCWACMFDTGPCVRPLTRGVNFDGGWAEYAITDFRAMIPIPDELPFEQAAIIPDAVSTPYAGVLRTGGLRPGESVGMWGVGGLGVHAVQVARVIGAAPIIAFDPLPEARERALRAGADLTFDPGDPNATTEVGRITAGHGLDVALDLVGHPSARDQALSMLGPRGRLSVIGLSPAPLTVTDSVAFSYRQQQIRGHYGYEPADLVTIVELLRWHRLDFSGSVSGVLPLAEAAEGVRRLAAKEGNPIRLVLKP